MHKFWADDRKITAMQLQCCWRNAAMGKFKIPEIPPTVNKTIRFPSDLVQQVEAAIAGKDCTFSAFVIAAVRAALEDLKDA
jgi:hypothetical protein